MLRYYSFPWNSNTIAENRKQCLLLTPKLKQATSLGSAAAVNIAFEKK